MGQPLWQGILFSMRRILAEELAALRSQYSSEFDYGIDGRPDIAIEF
jgi:hypothetical protein